MFLHIPPSGIKLNQVFTIPINNLKALLVGCVNCGISEEEILIQLKLDLAEEINSERIPYEMWERTWEIAQLIDHRPDFPDLRAARRAIHRLY